MNVICVDFTPKVAHTSLHMSRPDECGWYNVGPPLLSSLFCFDLKNGESSHVYLIQFLFEF